VVIAVAGVTMSVVTMVSVVTRVAMAVRRVDLGRVTARALSVGAGERGQAQREN
jgi:hypothetical protein